MTASPRPWVSVVIPIKDELESLTPLTDKLVKVLGSLESSRTAPVEILYVDDGSTDGSDALLDRLAEEHREVRVLHFDRNYGKTAALDAGFRHTSGEIVVELDGDLQNDPADIPEMISMAAHYDLVCGWRQDRHDNLLRKVSSRLAFFIRNAITRDGIHDTGCPFKVFRRTLLDRLPLFEGMHRFFPTLALMYGFTITEVPVRHYPRMHGRSKYGFWNRFFASLYDLVAVRWMQSRVLRYRFRQGKRP
ncbi:MAG TPA: glycosyltransferase family 2 protein [Nitrospiraceae bacterium]|jgi:glycosyltransferase involved in cell wall biosynthesis|nr:glycosyltransferase family 2 protein [Nitrospiraceae bacterium]